MSIQELQRRVSYLTYAIQNLIDPSGNNYARLDAENEFTERNTFTTLSLTQYIPHYALNNNLRNFMNNQTVEGFGDSITRGFGLTNPTTENWFNVLCSKFTNCTAVNKGVDASNPYDSFKFNSTGMTEQNVMSSHVSGRTTFIAWGTNILQRGVALTQPNSGQLDAGYIGYLNAMETCIIWSMLPTRKNIILVIM
jgi:hypothetical protein